MRGARGFGSVCVAALLCACGPDDHPNVDTGGAVQEIPNPDVPHERLPSVDINFEETSCVRLVEGYVTQCGMVKVPESPGSETTIELAVVRVFTNASSPQDEPVVYLEGGPGAPSVTNVDRRHPMLSRAAPDRDFIYVDQRGIGETDPALLCTEGGATADALQQCFQRLSEDSDLSAYNSLNNARDLDLIRQAFGYKKWNLYGISYGTRLGLTILRDFPSSVRAAVLDSVVPLEADILGEAGANGYSALSRVFDACDSDPACAEKYPDSLGQLLALVEVLNANPGGVHRDITGDRFVRLVFDLIYSPRGVELIPFNIDAASGGDFSYFEDLEAAVARPGFSLGMHLSLHCAEEVPFSSRVAVSAVDEEVPELLRPAFSGVDYFDYCRYWPVDKAPDSENEPAESDVPSLIFGGHFDPITPPRYAELVAVSLPNSRYFYMAGESHAASLGECGISLLSDFFDDPTRSLSDCSRIDPELKFATLSSRVSSRGTRGIEMKTVAPTVGEMEELKRDLRQRRR